MPPSQYPYPIPVSLRDVEPPDSFTDFTEWEAQVLLSEVSSLVYGRTSVDIDAMLRTLKECAPHVRVVAALRAGEDPSAVDVETVCGEIITQVDESLVDLEQDRLAEPEPCEVDHWPDMLAQTREITDSELELRAVLQALVERAARHER